MEAIHSSETSVHTKATQRHIPEDGILDYIHFELYVKLELSAFKTDHD
jgi:hypothetical protein